MLETNQRPKSRAGSQGAKFYPYYSFVGSSDYSFAWNSGNCTILFGNNSGHGINNFGGAKQQYGAPNLSWFYGQNSNGPQANPCIPQAGD